MCSMLEYRDDMCGVSEYRDDMMKDVGCCSMYGVGSCSSM